jgi:hypothetical protein
MIGKLSSALKLGRGCSWWRAEAQAYDGFTEIIGP